MPFDKSRYPKDWSAISKRIRERDGNKCAWCGAPNGQIVTRLPHGWWCQGPDWESDEEIWISAGGIAIALDSIVEHEEWDWKTGSDEISRPACRIWTVKIVLTVAHLGVPKPDGLTGDKHDKMDCRDENLAALCQSCHLSYDIDEHKANRKKTLAKRQVQKQEQSTWLQPALF